MRELTIESVDRLFPKAIRRHYDSAQIICYQGDRPEYIFFILKGHVRYYDVDDEGNEKVLHFMSPNNFFPMLFAFGVTKDIVGFYAALDEVEIVAIPRKDFLSVSGSNIDFANSLIRWFLMELNQLVYRISSLEKTDARVKILYALKYLADYHGHKNGKWQRLDFPITQQFLADFTGLTRETVSLTMQELRNDNVIITHKARQLDVSQSELKKIP